MTADPTPAVHDAARDDRPLLVGVDVGGSKIAVLVVDRDARVLARESAPASARPQSEASNVIAEVVRRALVAAGASTDDVAVIGVGVPGRVDPLTGAVSLAVNLGWSGFPLGDEMEARLGRPCIVENDARAAALGVHRRHVVDVDDLAYLSVGTGVSAGVILHGQLHRGARGLAGEIGHVVVDPVGAPCNCGASGCLETIISGSGIARQAREAVAAGLPTTLSDTSPAPTAIDVYDAVAAGDPLATEIADRVGRRLAWAVHLLVMTYDVERVVLGGGVSHAGKPFARPILRELDRLRATSALAREQLVPGIVDVLPPSADAGAWGAVTIAAAHAGTQAGQGWREVGHVRDP